MIVLSLIAWSVSIHFGKLIEGKDFSFEMDTECCGDCNGAITTDYTEKQITAKAYECYYKEHNMLTPTQIKSIRQEIGISALEFGKRLRVSYHHLYNRENNKTLYDKEFSDRVVNLVKRW